jgi:hypothetical protein
MENPLPPSAPETLAEPAPSLGSRLINVVTEPGALFEDLVKRPPSAMNWLAPALLLMLVGWLGSWLVMSQDSLKYQTKQIQERAFEQQVEKGKMTKEQLEAARPAMEKVGEISVMASAVAGPPAYAFAAPFWWAFVLWLIGAKVFKGDFTYMKAVEVAGLSGVIVLLGSILKTLLILAMDNLLAGTHLGMILGKNLDMMNRTHQLLMTVDVVTIWVIGVRAAGLARLANVSWGKAAVWLYGFWIVVTGSLLGLGLALEKIFGK